MSKTKQCPNCGGTYFFRRLRHSYEQHYNWKTGEGEFVGDGSTVGGKRAYCSDCKRDVTKLVGPK